MISLYPLIVNEVLKIIKRKRFLVILLILAVLLPMFTYAQLREAKNHLKQFGTDDWRAVVQQQVYDLTNRLGSNRVPEEWKKWMRVRVQQLQYYLDHNVNPESPNAVTFTRGFLDNAVSLFLPLLITVVAADIVSSERAQGTIKLMISKPVSRFKILLSKWIALMLFVSAILLCSGLMAYLISGLAFGYSGWTVPVFIGFQTDGAEVDFTHVRAVDQWVYLFMQFGLVWYSLVVVACLAFMVSVLVRSTAAAMGIMMASIISGAVLVNMVSSWESAKYFFMVNLQLTDYLSGRLPPLPSMTLSFSVTLLAVYAVVALIVSFWVFTRQDFLQ